MESSSSIPQTSNFFEFVYLAIFSSRYTYWTLCTGKLKIEFPGVQVLSMLSSRSQGTLCTTNSNKILTFIPEYPSGISAAFCIDGVKVSESIIPTRLIIRFAADQHDAAHKQHWKPHPAQVLRKISDLPPSVGTPALLTPPQSLTSRLYFSRIVHPPCVTRESPGVLLESWLLTWEKGIQLLKYAIGASKWWVTCTCKSYVSNPTSFDQISVKLPWKLRLQVIDQLLEQISSKDCKPSLTETMSLSTSPSSIPTLSAVCAAPFISWMSFSRNIIIFLSCFLALSGPLTQTELSFPSPSSTFSTFPGAFREP